MASKTIAVTEEVYHLLSRMKLTGESFSEMLTRLARKKGRISECAGLWKDMTEEDVSEIKESVRELRRSLASSLEKSETA